MKRLTRRHVVGRNRLDRDAGELSPLSIGHDLPIREPLVCGRRQDDRRTRFSELCDRGRVQMVTGIVGHEDEVGRLGQGQIALAPRIDVDDRPRMLDLHARGGRSA